MKMKLKTHRGAAKRFKKTATGKFKRGQSFKRHILTSKTTKRARTASVIVAEPDQPSSSGCCRINRSPVASLRSLVASGR